MKAALLQILVGLASGGFLWQGFRSFFIDRRKIGADYAEVISRAATNLLRPLEERIDTLEKQGLAKDQEITRLNDRLAAANRRIAELERKNA